MYLMSNTIIVEKIYWGLVKTICSKALIDRLRKSPHYL